MALVKLSMQLEEMQLVHKSQARINGCPAGRYRGLVIAASPPAV